MLAFTVDLGMHSVQLLQTVDYLPTVESEKWYGDAVTPKELTETAVSFTAFCHCLLCRLNGGR